MKGLSGRASFIELASNSSASWIPSQTPTGEEGEEGLSPLSVVSSLYHALNFRLVPLTDTVLQARSKCTSGLVSSPLPLPPYEVCPSFYGSF